jgi:hypothetical protein
MGGNHASSESYIFVDSIEKAILKFKCVHPSEIMSPTIFLKGDILIPPWAGEKSRETWLVPYSSIERVHYDNWVYE